MDIKRHLEGLDADQLIEVSYLVGRYLTHVIDDVAFRGMFKADAPASIGEASYSTALDIVRAIEAAEQRPIKELKRTSRDRYMRELAAAVGKMTRRAEDPRLTEALHNELEQLSF